MHLQVEMELLMRACVSVDLFVSVCVDCHLAWIEQITHF